MTILIVAVVVVIAVVVFFYNILVAKKNQVANIFGTIDVLLKKRYDLLPNLVSTVKGYMQYEKQVLAEITEMRAKAVSDVISDDQKIDLDNKVTRRLGDIMLAVENYPNLKANQNFLNLQRSLNEIEEQISAARRAYNASVTDYNNAVEMVPTSIIASMTGYRVKSVFEIDQRQRESIDTGKLLKG
ncbi:MAG: LemA family protein [Planctomycetota bacterium]|nr:LemA family protein [Planctomycetota bacterium]